MSADKGKKASGPAAMAAEALCEALRAAGEVNFLKKQVVYGDGLRPSLQSRVAALEEKLETLLDCLHIKMFYETQKPGRYVPQHHNWWQRWWRGL